MNFLEPEAKCLFSCKTVEGYTLKVLVELLHNIFKTACFIITPESISLRMMDTHRRTLVDLTLESSRFIHYSLEATDPLNIGVNLTHLNRMLRTIKRKDQLILFIKNIQTREIGIQVIPKDFSRLTTSFIKIQNIQNLEIDLPRIRNQSVLISSNEFSKMCKDIFNLSTHIFIFANPSHIKFQCNVGNVFCREVHLGDMDRFKSLEEFEFKDEFDTEQLGKILKISSLSSNFNIFYEKDLPLLFSSNIGSLGNIQIYIKSKSQWSESTTLPPSPSSSSSSPPPPSSVSVLDG